jgi:signal transduction histidine kinase
MPNDSLHGLRTLLSPPVLHGPGFETKPTSTLGQPKGSRSAALPTVAGEACLLQESIHDLVLRWESTDRRSRPALLSYEALVEAARRELLCESLGLYIIDPGSGSYRLVGQAGKSPLPKSIPGLPRPCSDQDGAQIQQLLREAISFADDSETVATFHGHNGISHVIGLRYQQTIYTYFFARISQTWSEKIVDLIKGLAELAFLTFQNRAAQNALRANEQPIDITGDEQTFHEELRRFIVEATGIQLVALRQLGAPGTTESRNLRCTVMSGWEEPTSEFDLLDYARFPQFERAVVNGTALFSPDPSSGELQDLSNEHPHLRIVESFAVFPIKDDERVIAVLSVASKCRLDFTPTFESIIGGIARSIGFTLKNRILHFEKAELQSSAIETAAALNGVELYSDLTHQMGNALSTIPEVVEAIATAASKDREITLNELLGPRYLGAIEESHDRISTLLAQAADVRSVASDNLQRASICQIWNDATSLVQYRLHKYDISTSCQKDFSLEVYPLQLRQVFFHLLLNSISAFSTRARRQSRKIELHTHQPKGTSNLLLRYIDNAGGINPSTLRQKRRQWSDGKQLPVEQAIFTRGVTSRQDGSGNGLWIVRQILQRHHGGIMLIDYHDGVVFDIELPLDLRLLTSRRKEM